VALSSLGTVIVAQRELVRGIKKRKANERGASDRPAGCVWFVVVAEISAACTLNERGGRVEAASRELPGVHGLVCDMMGKRHM